MMKTPLYTGYWCVDI